MRLAACANGRRGLIGRLDLSPFDFNLPDEQIALRPVEPRDTARLLVVRGDGRLEDHVFRDLPDHLATDDVLVFNNTKVLPAALKAVRPARDSTGNDVPVDINLVAPIDATTWRTLARPGRRLKPGDGLNIAPDFTATVLTKHEGGYVDLAFDSGRASLREALEAYGNMPLPPYIAQRRAADAQDKTHYQTRYADGTAASVAAPTAGLHFTDDLLGRLKDRGQTMETVRLHVGLGTFAPLTDAEWTSGRLHEEWRSIDPDTASRLNARRASGGRLVPVGTTAMRTLESAAQAGKLHPVKGPTDLFLRPGDAIQVTGGLVTNFHLPKSSLFMLVCALMGTDVMQTAYRHAIQDRYRFYSYGDACLLLP